MKKEKTIATRRNPTIITPKITQRDKYLYEWNLSALVNIYGRRILVNHK